MPRPRKWTDEQLICACQNSYSIREVIQKIGLIPAGGNYVQVSSRINELEIDITHFTGKGWYTGVRFRPIAPQKSLDSILTQNSSYQSHKLRLRLIDAGLKQLACELCGWAEVSPDGRIPLELDHINGDKFDNRLANLRILCPNCHSLQSTHRGLNRRRK